MSIYRKDTRIGACPAYVVYRREPIPGHSKEAINITAQDTLGLRVTTSRGEFYRRYSPGSCASYALEYNECPIEAYNEAVKKGHKTHWINQCSTVISDSPSPQGNVIEVHIGMHVVFEGRLFCLVPEPNNNLGLAPAIR